MNLSWTIPLPKSYFPYQLSYYNHFFLVGSCFTEHIGKFLKELKFQVIQNPAGILFDPHSIAFHLSNWANGCSPKREELFLEKELWYHWKYHSQFSSVSQEQTFHEIKKSYDMAIIHLKKTDWLIVTFGSSFSYRLNHNIPDELKEKFGIGYFVANCHKCPNQWFDKYLTPITETYELINVAFHQIKSINPKIRFLLNISPVRHLRDGVIENNRSKARLLEAIHLLVENREDTYYLPSYEIVIDVLRDYRFYDIDKAHPNYEATQWVLQYFLQNFFSKETQEIVKKIQDIQTAYNHKPRNPNTLAHVQFLNSYLEKTLQLQKELPHLDWSKELKYFNGEEYS